MRRSRPGGKRALFRSMIVGMRAMPALLFDGAPHDVGGKSVVELFVLVSPEFGVVFPSARGLEGGLPGVVSEGMAGGLEVNENVGVVASLEREGPAVQDRVAFVEDHVPRFHGDVVGQPVVAVDLDRPGLVHVLVDVENGRADQGHPVHVGGQDAPLGVDPNAVHAALRQLLPRPLLDRRAGRVPHALLETAPRPPQPRVLHAHHVRRRLPVIGVRVPLGPVLHLPIRFVLVGLPKRLDLPPHVLRRPDLLEPQRRVVLHAGRLAEGHFDAVFFRLAAGAVAVLHAVLFLAAREEGVVGGLRVAEVVDGRVEVFRGSGVAGRVDVVGEPGVVGGEGRAVDGEGDVDAVGGLAQGVDGAAGVGVGGVGGEGGIFVLVGAEQVEGRRRDDGGGGGAR
mmetsp:Transcript_28873/g.60792  ORF Transcript_28873/g.60792 Transcript_28873/m.60792 type:complete len:395 (+) Transcript_28873:529-1713(+)